jgi:hypothetical protein
LRSNRFGVVGCALALFAAGAAGAVPVVGAVDEKSTRAASSLSLWFEHDTNPGRLATDPLDDDEAPLVIPPDALLRVAADGSVDHARPGLRLHADVAGGGKLFFTAASERMVVGAIRTAAVVDLDDATAFLLSLSGKLRAQRSGARTYGTVRSDVGVQRALSPGWSCLGGAAGAAFDAFDEPLFSSAGGAFVVGCGVRAGRERVDVTAEAGVRGFPWAQKNPGSRDPALRIDTPATLSLSATSARALFLQGAVITLRNDSNVRGEAFSRLRLQGVVGVRLPAAVTATARLTGQWTRYDDGISLAQRYTLTADEETQNLAELGLTRALWGGLSLDARVAFFSNELSDGGARFARSTAAVGLRSAL